MRVLVMGCTGMLGAMVFRYLKKNPNLSVIGTSRVLKECVDNADIVFLDATDHNITYNINWQDFDFIINCIGAIKPTIDENDSHSVLNAIRLNALFPHKLVTLGPKVIHASTDCVFSGIINEFSMPGFRSAYKEDWITDAKDLYGRSKAMGDSSLAMNLRTSIIGPEFGSSKSLLEWFLNQSADGEVQGYTSHHWNGHTTFEWARIVETIIEKDLWQAGTYHIAGDSYTKAELLGLLKEYYEQNGRATASIKPVRRDDCNRTLATNYSTLLSHLHVRSLREQIRDMAERHCKGDFNE